MQLVTRIQLEIALLAHQDIINYNPIVAQQEQFYKDKIVRLHVIQDFFLFKKFATLSVFILN